MDAQRRDDVVPAVVVALLFAWYTLRCLIPALFEQSDVGLTLVVAALLAGTVALAVVPCLRRPKNRIIGRL